MDPRDLYGGPEDEQARRAAAAIEEQALASTSALTLEDSELMGHIDDAFDAAPLQSTLAGNITPEASTWARGADATQEVLLSPVAAGSSLRDVLDVPPRALEENEESDSNGIGRIIHSPDYDGPVPGADLSLEYNEGADLPSSKTAQQRLRRHSFSDDGSEGDGVFEEISQSASRSERGVLSSIRSGLVYSAVMMLHAVPTYAADDLRDDHPEQPDRIRRIYEKLKERGLVRRMKKLPIREVKMDEVMLVHDKSIWDGVQRTAFFTHESLMAQTHLLDRSSLYINEHSALCARLSCGGVIEMCDAVASGKVRNGFAIVRPPGHHAEPDRPMGFCFYNNVAVAACYLREKYGHLDPPNRVKRIMIVDWDVHHGNGTQAKFYDDEDILYVSIHRYEDGTFFPSGPDGNHDMVGFGNARGRNVNVPWPDKGMTDGDYLAAFSRIVMPIAREFAPDLVIISAGFDAAEGDQLGQCKVTPIGYAHMTNDLASLADGRLVVALEGGYDLDAIANSALAVTEVLLGETPPAFDASVAASTKAYDTFSLVERSQAPYWECMRRSHLEADSDEDEDLERMDISSLIASHRAQQVARKYNLGVLPLRASDSADPYQGQILCSVDLLHRPRQTLVLFVHDMGNLRVKQPSGAQVTPQQQLYHFVDGSSRVLDWTREHDMSIIDVCLHFQVPTAITTPNSRGARYNQQREAPNLEAAVKQLKNVWNQYINIAITARKMQFSGRPLDIVLIGLGTACAAVMQLINDKWPVIKDSVRAIVQMPGHSTIPTVTKGDKDLRKWYYERAMAILPHQHAYYTYDTQAQAGKRLGQIVRSPEKHAIQVLRTEFPRIQEFFAQHVPQLRPRANGGSDALDRLPLDTLGTLPPLSNGQGNLAESAIVID